MVSQRRACGGRRPIKSRRVGESSAKANCKSASNTDSRAGAQRLFRSHLDLKRGQCSGERKAPFPDFCRPQTRYTNLLDHTARSSTATAALSSAIGTEIILIREGKSTFRSRSPTSTPLPESQATRSGRHTCATSSSSARDTRARALDTHFAACPAWMAADCQSHSSLPRSNGD